MIKTIKDHMMKPLAAFLGKDRLDFYRDEYWLVYEAILFALVINSDFFERDISSDFPLYEKVILKGIEEGKLDILKNATKNTRKQSNNLFNDIVKYFALSCNITADQSSPEKDLADPYKIDMAFMQRCIPSYQVKNYFIAERKIHPNELDLASNERFENEEAVAVTGPSKKCDRTNASEKKRGQVGAEARWKDRDHLVECAKTYMLEEIGKGCRCRHDILSKIAYETFCYEDVPLKGLDKKGMGLKRKINDEARAMLPPNRRFGTAEYDPEIDCPLSNHWGFSRRTK